MKKLSELVCGDVIILRDNKQHVVTRVSPARARGYLVVDIDVPVKDPDGSINHSFSGPAYMEVATP